MIIHMCEQRSEEWYAARAGKFTASDFGDLMPSSRQGMGDWNKAQMNIIYRVAAERMTGMVKEQSWKAPQVEHGKDTEAEARIAYELETGSPVMEVGFVELNEWIGCSPDGLIDDEHQARFGGLEIKCPNSDTHLRYLNNPDDLLADYKYQCIGGMLCTGREW